MQDRDEHDQGKNNDTPDDADGDKFALYGFHVKHPEGSDEEGQVADQEDELGGTAAPPGIIPGEGADRVEQVFDEDAEGRPGDGNVYAVGDTQDLHFFVGEQHFRPDDSRDSEQKAYLYVQAEEDEECGSARRIPPRHDW